MTRTDLTTGQARSTPLVGRHEELATLVAAVSAPPAVVVVAGEAGIGKTRLVAELREQLIADGTAGRWFVTGACRQIREPFPLAPVLEAVRGLAADLASIPLSPVAGALRPLLPELASALPAQPPPLDDRAAERHRVFRALAEVLGSIGPVALVLEDLHWADGHTADFLSYLLGDPPPKLSLVITFRGDEVDPAVRSVAAKLPSPVSRTELPLGPLGEQETGLLAGAILQTGWVSQQFADYLHERTSGVPFAIEEVLALLRARGTLAGERAGWTRQALAALDVPAGIRDPVLARVSRLPASAREVVEAAAVLQTPVPAAVLTRTCRSPARAARAAQALDQVLESGLLAEAGQDGQDGGHGGDGDRVGFRHPLAAQAVYEAMPAARRRRLHGRAADSLAALAPALLGQLAHHLRRAGRLGAWVAAAERAADQALALGHDDEAARLLEDVLQQAPLAPEPRGRLAVKLARAAIETLRARDVRALLLAVPVEALPRTVRSELRFWLSALAYQTGDPVLHRRLCLAAVEELTERPDLQAWAMVGLGIPAGAPGVPLVEHRHWLERALAVVPELTDPSLRVLVLGKVAMVLTSLGDPAWRELTAQLLASTGGAPRRRREVSAYLSVGVDACYAGHHQTASQLLTPAVTGADACHSRRLELRALAQLAMLDYCRGSWDGLRERAELVADELSGCPESWVDAEVVAACLALAHGDLDQAGRRLAGVVKVAERAGGLDLLPLPVGGLLRLAVARGELADALAISERVLAGIAAKGVWAPAARLLPPLAQAMVAAGRTAQARATVNRLARQPHELDAPLLPAAVRHARGFLAANVQRWRPAAEQFLAAATRYDQLSCPYEAAQAREAAAGCLFEAGDPRAEPQLCAAAATYQQLGASWDAARAASLGRRHGAALPGRHRGGRTGYGDQLSPREREVAGLAATGLTNGEIAQQLFLSPKTVDKHLCAALRKLGLRSRRLLGHQFGKDGVSTP